MQGRQRDGDVHVLPAPTPIALLAADMEHALLDPHLQLVEVGRFAAGDNRIAIALTNRDVVAAAEGHLIKA